MELLLPFVLLIFASFFQGSFGLGMKYMSPLSWEAWWLIHVTIAMIIFPFLWAIIVVPNLFDIISSSPVESIQMAMLYGFLWGIGGIMFGVSVPYIGLSLTMGIVMGLAGSVGSLIPFFQGSNSTSDPVFSYVLGGLLISLVGVAFTAKAGIARDKLQNSTDSNKLFDFFPYFFDSLTILFFKLLANFKVFLYPRRLTNVGLPLILSLLVGLPTALLLPLKSIKSSVI